MAQQMSYFYETIVQKLLILNFYHKKRNDWRVLSIHWIVFTEYYSIHHCFHSNICVNLKTLINMFFCCLIHLNWICGCILILGRFKRLFKWKEKHWLFQVRNTKNPRASLYAEMYFYEFNKAKTAKVNCDSSNQISFSANFMARMKMYHAISR